MSEQLFKQCPDCKEFLGIETNTCTSCGHDFVDAVTETPKKKKRACGQIVLVSLSVLSAVIFVAIALAFALDDDKGKSSQLEVQDDKNQQESNAIQIAATDLISEYRENEIAADLKYKDKLLYVTGVIEDFSVGLFDQKYLSLSDDEAFSFRSVHCNISDENVGLLVDLEKGQEVVVKGLSDGMTILSISLDDCTVVETR